MVSLSRQDPIFLGWISDCSGSIKSALGIGSLLLEGIGDTIRVSLTDDPVEEVHVGYEILKSLGLASRGATIVACPTCGRLEVDLFKIAGEMEEELKLVQVSLKGNGASEKAASFILELNKQN